MTNSVSGRFAPSMRPLARPHTQDIWDRPGDTVSIIFAERCLIAAEALEFLLAGVDIELSFGTAFQMLRSHQSYACCQQFSIQVMHGKRRAREDKQNTAFVVFGQSSFTPFLALLAPLIHTRMLDQAQILNC